MNIAFPEITDDMSDEDLRQVAIECAKILREEEGSSVELVRLINKWVVDRHETWIRFATLIETDYKPGKNFWSEGVA